MRIVQHGGRALIAVAAKKVLLPLHHLGRLGESDPLRPWDEGWGALWCEPDASRFAGIVSPRGDPARAWLFAGRNVWGRPNPATLLHRYEYTYAELFDAEEGPLSCAARLVENLYNRARVDPAIPPP